MGRGKRLSLIERGKISAYADQGKSKRWIGRKIGRSEKVVRNLLKDETNYGSKKTGPKKPTKVTPRLRRQIIKSVSNQVTSSAKVKSELGLDISARTIRDVIKKDPSIRYEKMKTKPKLTSEHKEKRLSFARNVMSWTKEWNKVIHIF